MEWTNLAKETRHADAKKQLAAWLPKTNVKDAPSQKRKPKKKPKTRKQP